MKEKANDDEELYVDSEEDGTWWVCSKYYGIGIGPFSTYEESLECIKKIKSSSLHDC